MNINEKRWIADHEEGAEAMGESSEERCVDTAIGLLRRFCPCNEAVVMMGDSSPETAWAECEHLKWMLWAVVRLRPDLVGRIVVLAKRFAADAQFSALAAAWASESAASAWASAAAWASESESAAAAWASVSDAEVWASAAAWASEASRASVRSASASASAAAWASVSDAEVWQDTYHAKMREYADLVRAAFSVAELTQP